MEKASSELTLGHDPFLVVFSSLSIARRYFFARIPKAKKLGACANPCLVWWLPIRCCNFLALLYDGVMLKGEVKGRVRAGVCLLMIARSFLALWIGYAMRDACA